jgi:murein DD-endopeptidase MepM/ murein hydrolase activator NlpD
MRRQSKALLNCGILLTFACSSVRPTAQAPIYLLPYPVGTSCELLQGYNGPWGHDGKAAYAYDFKMPIGSPVTAARDGIVVKVEARFEDGNRTAGQENFMFIDHGDGTFGRYYHLTKDGVLVGVGKRVLAGQVIGRSGNTGASAGPHLHFDVTQTCPEWGCQTISISFSNSLENPLLPDHTYEALQSHRSTA